MKKLVYSMLFLFAVGVVGTLISVSASGGFSPETWSIHDEVQVKGAEISRIEVDLSGSDVALHPTDGDEIIVELNGKISKKHKEKVRLDVDDNGGTLKVGIKGLDQIFLNVGVLILDTNVEVFLPQKIYDSIHVNTSSGDITVQGFKAKKTLLEASSGDLLVRDFHSDQHMFQTSSGEMELSNVTGDIEAKSSSGDILIKYENTSGNLDAKTSSGDINVEFREQPDSLAIDFKGSSGEGRVSLDGVNYQEKSENEIRGVLGSGDYKIKAETSSGDFSLR
jgi:lia operon protein LiaG